MVKVLLKGGVEKEFESGIAVFDIAKSISEGLARASLACEIDGKLSDLRDTIEKDCSLNLVSFKDLNGKKAFWHTSSHIMAQAVKRLYPNTKLAIGPSITNGFYYDIDSDEIITPEVLLKIEEEMKSIIKEDLKIERFELSREEALRLMKEKNEDYKIDLINDLPVDVALSFYKQGEFVDLCAGPHLFSTGKIKAFKLTSVAGAYWRGDSNKKMLQRIYGTSYPNKSDLDEYLLAIEEAKKRDHRKLGKELDLFSIDDYIGQGLILWHPKLSVVREEIERYWRKEHRKRGYQYVYTPHIGMSNLWETSGHLDHFADGMYPAMKMSDKDEDEVATYYAKPMGCPFHVRIYKSKPRSYRELPIRYCELGSVYRFEPSGALHGMLRVRGFTQDDAHIVCTKEQFVSEVNQTLDFALDMNKAFGYEKLNVYLSLRDPENKEKYIENEEIWQLAETTLEKILKDRNIDFEKDIGGAKFYGPAIDLKAVDAMGREWQGTTIQLDMNLPTKFGMGYIGSDGEEHSPIMLHRTLLGSMERFVGTLIEHYAGAFPIWLSPTQVRILTVSDKQNEYAKTINEYLLENDIRTELDDRNEKIGFKIRESQLEKIPYTLIIGDNEEKDKTVSYRIRRQQETKSVAIEEFVSKILEDICTKRFDI